MCGTKQLATFCQSPAVQICIRIKKGLDHGLTNLKLMVGEEGTNSIKMLDSSIKSMDCLHHCVMDWVLFQVQDLSQHHFQAREKPLVSDALASKHGWPLTGLVGSQIILHFKLVNFADTADPV